MFRNTSQMWSPWMMGWGMLFWFLIIVGFGYLVWASYRPRSYTPRREDPVEVARMRLARGEITIEEFERIKKTIEESS